MKLHKLLPILLGLCAAPAFADGGRWIADDTPGLGDQLKTCATPRLPTGTWEGQRFVRLAFQVAADGKILHAKVVQSSLSSALDDAAIKSLAECRLALPGVPAEKWLTAGYTSLVTVVQPATPVPPAPGKRSPAMVDFASCDKPVWPRLALREEYTGTATLKFLVGADGVVQDSQIELTSGYPLLDYAALEGIERCRFKPATVDGVAQSGWQRMQYVWTLENDRREHGRDLAKLQAGIAQGKAEARYQMAMFQLKGGNSLVANDEAAAMETIAALAEGGLRQAQEALGIAYLTGKGAVRNPELAAKWLRKAAEQDSISAQFALARMTQTGEGVPRDFLGAFQWYGKAGAGGIPQAFLAMADMLLESGQPAHLPIAVDLLKKLDTPAAQMKLAECHEKGLAVPQDLARAKELYRLAAKAGKPQARQALLRLGEEL